MTDVIKEWSEFLGDPWDWSSFGWGMLAGSIVTIALGGVTLYFTWPYLIGIIRGVASTEEILKALGVRR